MTVLADKKGGAPRAWTKGATAQMGHASKRSPGVISHPRVPFSYPVIARAESPWRSTVRQQANHITRPPSPRHDGLSRPSLALSPRNDKERVVTEPTPSFPTTLSSRGRSPWRSTMSRWAPKTFRTR